MIQNIHHDRPGQLGELGQWDWVTSLFGGKSQAWWDRLNDLQKRLAVQLAEVTAFSESLWDTVQGKIAQMIREGKAGLPPRFPGYAWTVGQLEELAVNLVATKNRAPTNEDMNFAERLADALEPAIAFAKRVAPEMANEVEQARRKVEANLRGSELRSPEDVGQEAFVKVLEERAKKLGVGLGVGLGLLAVLGVGLFALSTAIRPRSNPKRRDSALPLVAAGGIAYLVLTKEKAPPPRAPGVTVAAPPPPTEPAEFRSVSDVERRFDEVKTLYRMGRMDPKPAAAELEILRTAAEGFGVDELAASIDAEKTRVDEYIATVKA